MEEVPVTQKRRWGRVVLGVLLTPIVLFVILMALLYVPPVQNLIRQKATAMASEASGMEINVGRIDLRFPLNLQITDVCVVQYSDTLLNLDKLNIRVQALPLLAGQVEIDEVTLENVQFNTSTMLEGMKLKGRLGRFFLESHGVDLTNEEVTLNQVELDNTQLQVTLNDTTVTPEDTTTSLPWKIKLHTLELKNIGLLLDMPFDSVKLNARIGMAQISEAKADLLHQYYGWQRFLMDKASLHYDVGNDTLMPGFDPSHIALRNIKLAVDSVNYAGRNISAHIRTLTMAEQSGLNIISGTGRLQADSSVIEIPMLKLQTPHSEMSFHAHTYWELIDLPTNGHLSALFQARIGKQDVILLTGNLPDTFKEAYPEHPLVIHAGTEGNLREMQLSRFFVNLPGAFELKGQGLVRHLADSLYRSGQFDFAMQTHDLNFLTGLAEVTSEGSLIVPDSMQMNSCLTIEGSQYQATMHLTESEGSLELDASYNTSTQNYEAHLRVDSLQLNHFMPQDSLYLLTTTLDAHGKGLDFASSKTVADVKARLDQLHYGHWKVTDIDLKAGLKESVASLKLHSNNSLLKMNADGNLRFDKTYLDGQLNMDVSQVALYELGLAPQPLKRPFAFKIASEARHDSVKIRLDAGDLNFRFRARSTLKKMMEKGNEFTTLLLQQIDDRYINHAALRQLMPSAGFHLMAGKENPLSYYLATKNIAYDDIKVSFGLTPQVGINGRAAIHGFRMDSLQMDTIYVLTKQDTTKLRMQAGIINAPGHPHVTFSTSLTAEVRNDDAELTLDYADDKGNTGILLGANFRPLTEGNGKGNGLLLRLTPEEPIIAYNKFRFIDGSNWAYLHKNMRAYAHINMESEDGLGFRLVSNREDTVSLQNMNMALSRLNLEKLSDVLPYVPRLTGLLTVDALFVQDESNLQLSAESSIENLTFENRSVGDIGLGATWLPGGEDKHYLNAYMMYDNREVLLADGLLHQQGEKQQMDVNTSLESFPLRMINAFVPGQLITMTGELDGEISMNGTMEKPALNGELKMDSVSLYARQVGARYWFDNRPVVLADNQLHFDKFSIYTTSKNPFTIDGLIDLRNLANPTANLTLNAENYTLLDAPRTRESLVYGKVFVDLNARIRGALDALTMRGNMNLLGNTDVTYVLTESPLTVEDRLDGLVTFTSFTDTASVKNDKTPVMSLGGLNMNMQVHIDEAVRLRADLSSDRSKYVELEGGGDLNMQYSPQGDLNFTGRYTLSGGTMKYSLPIIPLKEFAFSSGSYVDWRGNIMNPELNLKATERIRASVADGDGATRMVNFDVSISIKNRLEAPELVFDIAAPEDVAIQNELQAMGAEERSKQAIAMLATGIYLNSGVKGGGLDMGTALNSVLQSQINALAGSALQSSNANLSLGVENRTSAETGDTQTDYSFRYSQRFFNDRVQIVIGGKVTSGNNATNNAESFIDNISLEYRLDNTGTRYVRVFHNKNYESILDGEITETGAGIVLRKKVDRLGELFIFKKKK